MGKIVMPKNSAVLEEMKAVLQIYNEANDWVENESYTAQLKTLIGADQYSSSYTKKSQITSYFGFTEWENISSARSRRRITDSGRRFYSALISNNTQAIQEEIMSSLETSNFGRNNFGCPDSNSDIEPPCLFIRAIFDLNYLTYKDFAFLLWKLEDCGGNYTDAIAEVRRNRTTGSFTLEEPAQKYTDAKPIMMLIRWGFLAEENTVPGGAKQISINDGVLSRFEQRLRNLKIYNIDKTIEERPIPRVATVAALDEDEFETDIIIERITGGYNVLLYGVPGSGKSFTVKNQYCNDESRMERVVFHPDYTYTDFIGQILPQVTADSVSYLFTPGPFTRLLKKAWQNPGLACYLLIEEINRGNAPAIFGEVFQLLDRDEKGQSTYKISNAEVAYNIFGDANKMISLPSNLFVVATMNTSDQNVFTLDTAFQRRWDMRMIENDIASASHANTQVLDTELTWQRFAITINDLIMDNNVGMVSSEDKRLGAYFVVPSDLEFDKNTGSEDPGVREKAIRQNSKFPEKVIKYLWDAYSNFLDENYLLSNFAAWKI
jgi:hypothetical protein